MCELKNSSIVCINDLEAVAAKVLPKYAWDYYSSGANGEYTLKRNVDAYASYILRPRVLRSISNPKLETTIQGHKISFPICIAPTAMHRMAHPEGELATARAGTSSGTCMCLSTLSTTSIEEVASAVPPNALLWFQLYIYNSWDATVSLIKRAEDAGYKALALTVDAPKLGMRYSDERNSFSLPSHLGLQNLASKDAKFAIVSGNSNSGLSEYFSSLIKPDIGWDIISKLKSITSLPIILKGIHTPEDSLLAVQHGADGIWVSNHGARQLDTVDSTIEMLDEISQALGSSKSKIELYLDGGIRYGTDILKALSLGARAIFIGRPVLWGLTYNGEDGVKLALEMLRKELEIAMLLSGCDDVQTVDRLLVRNRINHDIQSKL